MILAIDTSGSIASIALGSKEGLVAEYHFAHDMDLLRRLTPAIERIISDAGITASDLSGIVTSLGPGSFTGLRIGVTAAKTLAWSMGIPLVGVSTLEAIARSCSYGGYKYICAMIYSRVGEVYWAVLDTDSASLITEPLASDLEEVISYLRNLGENVLCCGSGIIRNREIIGNTLANITIAPDWASFARGAALLKIGMSKINSGQTDDPLTLTPLYVKKPTPVVRKESVLQGHK